MTEKKPEASSINWQWPHPFVKKITIKTTDTDRLGHTNNVRYLEWLEGIAWEHIKSLGSGWEEMHKLGNALAITRTEIDYIAASYKDDELLLGTWITASDQRFKCARHFQLIRLRDTKTILRAHMQFACISLKNGRPTKMPVSIIKSLDEGLEQARLN